MDPLVRFANEETDESVADKTVIENVEAVDNGAPSGRTRDGKWRSGRVTGGDQCSTPESRKHSDGDSNRDSDGDRESDRDGDSNSDRDGGSDSDSNRDGDSNSAAAVDKTRVYGLLGTDVSAAIVAQSVVSDCQSSTGSLESLPLDPIRTTGDACHTDETEESDSEQITVVEEQEEEEEEQPVQKLDSTAEEHLEADQRSPNAHLYPDADLTIWLRSCEQEQIDPLPGEVSGAIPLWLRGDLLRNGPGKLYFGPDRFDHLFDGSAVLHRFSISNGVVTYQNRFLQTNTFKKNSAAQRIVVDEFGTLARVPDPCQNIFQRFLSFFRGEVQMSDNAMISVYPYGDQLYALTESPFLFRFDAKSLETLGRVALSDHVYVANHSSHPHVLDDGTVVNIGQRYSATGPEYCVIRFPPTTDSESAESPFARAELIGCVKSRWHLYPSYMHSFCVTENYIVLIEQPLAISILQAMKTALFRDKLMTALTWFENEQTHFIVIDKKSGKRLKRTFECAAFFFLHTINAHETSSNDVIVDICCYRNASMLQCLHIDSLKNGQSDSHYAEMFRSRAMRFVLPLSTSCTRHVQSRQQPHCSDALRQESCQEICQDCQSAGSLADCVRVESEQLAALGCEIPRINYAYNGRQYRYFYAITSDVDAVNALIKVDVEEKRHLIWSEPGKFPSEPIFVASPNAQTEDDGVILSVLLEGGASYDQNAVQLLVLNASDMSEVARARFRCPSCVPKCLHGWFKSE